MNSGSIMQVRTAICSGERKKAELEGNLEKPCRLLPRNAQVVPLFYNIHHIHGESHGGLGGNVNNASST